MTFPPEMFTSGNVTPPDSLYEELALKYPHDVYRNTDGEWTINIWVRSGIFTQAIKEFYARSASGPLRWIYSDGGWVKILVCTVHATTPPLFRWIFRSDYPKRIWCEFCNVQHEVPTP